ncbi:hypothetical protein BDR22DRAFT_812334 [Usnea florida]
MRPTVGLLQLRTLITLFTRENCSLCDTAKSVITKVSKKRRVDYHEVDVMASEWRRVYEFDVPVLHVQRVSKNSNECTDGIETRKLMHHFDQMQVEKLIDETEGQLSLSS